MAPRKLFCQLCNLTDFKSVFGLIQHMAGSHIHEDDFYSTSEEQGADRHSPKTTGDDNDLEVEPTDNGPEDDPAENDEDVLREMIECIMCKEVLSTEADMRGHKCYPDTSQAQPTHECPNCPNEAFGSEEALREHVASVHIKADMQAPFICQFCPGSREFKAEHALKGHITRFHTREAQGREYWCSICNKRYTSNFGLKRHTARMHKIKTEE